MNIKVKFDKNAIQAFFLENGEKFVFGFMALIFVWMAYASTQVERFQQKPEQLANDVTRANTGMQATPKDEPPVVVKPYAKLAEESHQPIHAEQYAFATRLDPGLVPKRPARDAVELFAVEKLQGAAEVGAFQMSSEAEAKSETVDRSRTRTERERAGARAMPIVDRGGRAGVRGQRWIVVTGLVPIDKQTAAFEELKNSVVYDASTDTPRYLGYKVERVELADDGEKPDWSKAVTFFSGTAVQQVRRLWSGERHEVAPMQTIDQDGVLAFPLGPMMNRDWDKTAVHAPEIKMATSDMPQTKRQRTPEAKKTVTPPDANNPYGPVEPVRRTEEMVETPRQEEAKTSPYLLFRFFDFTVQPSKRYAYRVQLGLRNPNYNLKPTLLAKADLAKSPYIETKWSEPSSAIFVPEDTKILAVSAKPARGRGEPVSQVLMVKWQEDTGMDASEEFPLLRGQIANFTGTVTTAKPKPIKTPKTTERTPARTGRTGKTQPRTGAKGSREVIHEPTIVEAPIVQTPAAPVKYESNAIGVDFRGGEALRGKRPANDRLLAPAEILILNADGTLSLHNELDEADERAKLTSHETEEIRPREGGGSPRGLRDIMGP